MQGSYCEEFEKTKRKHKFRKANGKSSINRLRVPKRRYSSDWETGTKKLPLGKDY